MEPFNRTVFTVLLHFQYHIFQIPKHTLLLSFDMTNTFGILTPHSWCAAALKEWIFMSAPPLI